MMPMISLTASGGDLPDADELAAASDTVVFAARAAIIECEWYRLWAVEEMEAAAFIIACTVEVAEVSRKAGSVELGIEGRELESGDHGMCVGVGIGGRELESGDHGICVGVDGIEGGTNSVVSLARGGSDL